MTVSDIQDEGSGLSTGRAWSGRDESRSAGHGDRSARPNPAEVAVSLHRHRARDVLIVDPDPQALLAAEISVQSVADVEACSDFRFARARIVARPPDLLVTNLRLGAFNGLHLVYLAADTATRCIVYAAQHDPVLAREVLAAGAFYERADRLPRVLESYARAMLPPRDRRSLSVLDRRSAPRGGRRCIDDLGAT
jgi:hypothetical protein